MLLSIKILFKYLKKKQYQTLRKKIFLTIQLAGVAISGLLSTSCKESITRKISLEIINKLLIIFIL